MHELEQQKLQSEIDQNKAQQEKFRAETEEIRKRSSARLTVLKSVIGTLIAAGLLAAWFIGNLKPLFDANADVAKLENEELRLQAKIDSHNAEIQKQANQAENQRLVAENERQKHDWDKLVEAQRTLEESLIQAVQKGQTLEEQLRETAERATTALKGKDLEATQRQQLEDQIRKTNQQLSQLKAENEGLKAASAAAAQQSRQIAEQRDTRLIKGQKIAIFHEDSKERADQIADLLRKYGAEADVYNGVGIIGSDLIRYGRPKRQTAQQVVEVLFSLLSSPVLNELVGGVPGEHVSIHLKKN